MPAPHEGRVFPAGNIRTAFETEVAQAKIEDFRFHDLRHTFASRFVMAGGSVHALQKILGHADLKMTMRYAHLSQGHLREEMLKTAGASQSVIQTPTQTEPIDSSRGDEVEPPD